MQYAAKTVREYIDLLPEDRRPVIDRLRQIISANLPDGFEEQIAYGMISFSVPLSRYPAGYHAKKGEPLPFISLASQKNHVALYHMALYSEISSGVSPEGSTDGSSQGSTQGSPQGSILNWFSEEYQKRLLAKPDIGKSCIRFKNISSIPYDLIGELCRMITVDEYISIYKKALEGSR